MESGAVDKRFPLQVSPGSSAYVFRETGISKFFPNNCNKHDNVTRISAIAKRYLSKTKKKETNTGIDW